MVFPFISGGSVHPHLELNYFVLELGGLPSAEFDFFIYFLSDRWEVCLLSLPFLIVVGSCWSSHCVSLLMGRGLN